MLFTSKTANSWSTVRSLSDKSDLPTVTSQLPVALRSGPTGLGICCDNAPCPLPGTMSQFVVGSMRLTGR